MDAFFEEHSGGGVPHVVEKVRTSAFKQRSLLKCLWFLCFGLGLSCRPLQQES